MSEQTLTMIKDYLFVVAQISTSHVNDVWWLDLGTTKHMIGCQNLVDMEDDSSDGYLVTIVDEATYEVKEKVSLLYEFKMTKLGISKMYGMF